MNAGDRIPDEMLTRPVTGLNLVPGTLADQLGEGMNLVVFLRHFGCIFCRETLADIRAAMADNADFPTPLFFFQGTPTEGRAFLRRYGPELRAVADPTSEFYDGFGIQKGGPIKMLGPSVWRARSRAMAKGHENGERGQDIWRMPGLFVTCGPRIVWSHEYRHAADLPDYVRVREVSVAEGVAAQPVAQPIARP